MHLLTIFTLCWHIFWILVFCTLALSNDSLWDTFSWLVESLQQGPHIFTSCWFLCVPTCASSIAYATFSVQVHRLYMKPLEHYPYGHMTSLCNVIHLLSVFVLVAETCSCEPPLFRTVGSTPLTKCHSEWGAVEHIFIFNPGLANITDRQVGRLTSQAVQSSHKCWCIVLIWILTCHASWKETIRRFAWNNTTLSPSRYGGQLS